MKLYEAIRKTIEMEDESVIVDYRFVNYLSDMQAFSESVSIRNVFKQLCVSGFMADVYNLWEDRKTMAETQVRNHLKQKANSASQQFGYKNENVLFCLESVAYALQLISSISVIISKDYNTSVDAMKLIGYWDFTFKKDRTIQLTIGRDGYAKASSGTKYSWKLSGNEVEFFIPDMVSYKGVIEGDTITGTAYSCYNPIGWKWSAARRGDGMTLDNLTSGVWVIVNEVPDLDDNEVRFLPNNILESNLYGNGKWYLDDDNLEIITANEFIKYVGKFVKGHVIGKGRNQISNEWIFKLIKK